MASFLSSFTDLPTLLQVMDRDARRRSKKPVSFWFATGGAGVCLSRALAARFASEADADAGADATGSFERAGESIRLPDDVTLGFVSEHRLRVPLTRVRGLHSHLEPLAAIPEERLAEQVRGSSSSIHVI